MESQEHVRLELPDAVADQLSTTTANVYALAREGLLPCVRIGRLVRFDPRAVGAFIEKGGRPLTKRPRSRG